MLSEVFPGDRLGHSCAQVLVARTISRAVNGDSRALAEIEGRMRRMPLPEPKERHDFDYEGLTDDELKTMLRLTRKSIHARKSGSQFVALVEAAKAFALKPNDSTFEQLCEAQEALSQSQEADQADIDVETQHSDDLANTDSLVNPNDVQPAVLENSDER
jgi:hypothetical protein